MPLGYSSVYKSGRDDSLAVTECNKEDIIHLRREEVSCKDTTIEWLDLSDPVMAAFADLYGPALVPRSKNTATLYMITTEDLQKLERVSEDLHLMFLHATEHVMGLADSDPLLRKFDVPDRMWPLIRRSWRKESITIAGRFDLALGPKGPKVYEYNADSAATLVECGLIQDRWAHAAIGDDAAMQSNNGDVGDKVFRGLVESWRAAEVQGTLHLMCDDDPEERLHTLYMKSAAEAAGIHCKIIVGIHELNFAEKGAEGAFGAARAVVDADGEVIRNVWKTWSWMTVLSRNTSQEKPDLPDVLLSDRVRVWEPLWTLVLGSKALLPILCQMYPQHPLLLCCDFAPSPRMLSTTGFAVKPVHGRCGNNVTLIGPNARFIEKRQQATDKTAEPTVYQELQLLPRYGLQTVQVGCFVSRGRYIGSVLRVESRGSQIINQSSECVPLRSTKQINKKNINKINK